MTEILVVIVPVQESEPRPHLSIYRKEEMGEEVPFGSEMIAKRL